MADREPVVAASPHSGDDPIGVEIESPSSVPSSYDSDPGMEARKALWHRLIVATIVVISVIVAITVIGQLIANTSSSAPMPATPSSIWDVVRIELEPPATADAMTMFIVSSRNATSSVVNLHADGISVEGMDSMSDAAAIGIAAIATGNVDVVRLFSAGSSVPTRFICRNVGDKRCPAPTSTALCSADHFGKQCSSCPDCNNGHCDDGDDGTGSCICNVGVSGDRCNSCKDGYFGVQCKPCQDCSAIGINKCNDGLSGDGECLCVGGFEGRTCAHCQPGHFGPSCTPCAPCGLNQICLDGIRGNGHCICRAGFTGPLCDRCISGFFGAGCLSKCACVPGRGTCRDGISGNGQCICQARMAGRDCSQCEIGWSGADCSAPGSGLQSFNWCGGDHIVALTFDGGLPSDTLLDTLKALNVSSTFFISAGSAPVLPSPIACDIVHRITGEGHSLQAGGYHGTSVLTVDTATIDRELSLNDQWIGTCLGAPMAMNQFRPPAGQLDSGRARYINDKGYVIASWNIDASQGNVEQQFISLPTGNWSAVVRFNMGVFNVALLPQIIGYIRSLKYTFVLSRDCFILCTGGAGVCRDPRSATLPPGVFDTGP